MSVWRIFWRGFLVVFVLAAVALVVAWALRKDIARGYADREIKRRGLSARYQITEITPSRQRLEKISLGDPANPDLTADWAEVITTTGFSGVKVASVRAGGVRLKGRMVDGRPRFGEVDKLLPPPSNAPFTLPDFRVDLTDARLRLDTPYGPVGARFDGKGNIARSLRGKLAAIMPRAAFDPKCSATRLTAYLDITTNARTLSAKGPVRADTAGCRGIEVAGPQMAIDVVTSEAFDRFDGDIAAQTAAMQYAGHRLNAARGNARLTWAKGAIDGDGTMSASGVTANPALIDRAARQMRAADATPVAPIADGIATAILGLKRGSSVRTRFSVGGTPKSGSLVLDGIDVRGVSGAALKFAQASSVKINWPKGDYRIDGGLALAGGGFPLTRVAFDRRSRELAGVATIAPLTAVGTRLALSPIRFSLGRAVNLDTVATFDGPLGGGVVRSLVVPVRVRGGTLTGECFPFALASYRLSNLSVAPVKTSVCLKGGQALLGAQSLAGRLGDTPLTLAFASARYGLGNGIFNAAGLAVRLGDAKRLSLLDIATLDGTYANGAASGRFAGASGQIGNVPLLMTEIAGDWGFADRVLTLGGALRVADAAVDRRYLPLISDDVKLRLADNKITATGTLREPFSRTVVSGVSLFHDLDRSTGNAVLDVNSLTFNNAFQPEVLTPITLGVIANVQGAISGRGDIRWGDIVTSSGTFRTDNLDFAAAFGPVTGLKGEITLSDLLGLETGPGQSVAIAGINPGVAVTDGVIRYRLLPDLKLGIEGGRWPFAGGALILEPSVLDLNQSATRRLTFRVEGLDAALFVEQMAFENMAVTGKFDGTLPMVFDQTGGRIEGGKLTVREEGGTLSYIGEVSNADLGRFSKLAFDALKSIRYRKLTLELDGALDGEMVTVVRFNGVNQLPLAQTRNFFLKQFNEIPFLFNITIKAPFRGLFSMFRSFNDPSVFIPRVLQPQLVPVPPKPVDPPAKPVQPKESEPVR